jgi:HlyD family secretion protein
MMNIDRMRMILQTWHSNWQPIWEQFRGFLLAEYRRLRALLTSQTTHDDPDGIRRSMTTGLVAAVLLVGGVGGWAATAHLAGAVLAQGSVVVDSSVKKVQHASGGTIGEIRVKDGDRVEQSVILIKLDETLVRANLQIITKQLDELAIRHARLAAERDSATQISTPSTFGGREKAPEITALVVGENNLFEARRLARTGQKAQLNERITQLQQEANGVTAQLDAKANELQLVEKELVGADKLWQQNLMPITKLTSLRREAARLKGERAQLIAQMAQVRGKAAEIALQIIQIDQDLRAEVTKDLREVEAKNAELSERRVAAEDQLRHIEIRAPIAGVVHQLNVHTVGGVIGQGETLMELVPESDALVIEAKIAPQDIDQVRQGQPAFIRFSAFDQRSTPEFEATVTRVAADLTTDTHTGVNYYVARLHLKDAGVAGHRAGAKIDGKTLIPGMPAEVHIRTEERTALSYFLKPLSDQIARAFVER